MRALPRMAPLAGPPIANGAWGLFAVTSAFASIWTTRETVPVRDVRLPRDLNWAYSSAETEMAGFALTHTV